jgi:mannose-6-phosphate isomerase-like protein (cupin superfamily)
MTAMPEYTIRNLEEIEDAAPSFGMAPDVEARFGRRVLECSSLGISYERLAPNARMPFGHKHALQEEVYFVIGGSGRMKIEDDVVDLRARDFVRVGRDTMRSFEAGPAGLELLAAGAPIPDEPDAEIVQGWWAD